MSQKLLSLLLTLIFSSVSFGQATNKSTAVEDAAKLEKDAVEFLRETAGDVGRMRSMENRISFSAELASLMWFHDEKEAKQMYGGVVADFKQLLSQFDAQMNTLSMPEDDDLGGGGFLFGGYGRSKVERKFRIAMAVRQQIASSLAEHAPDLAFNFFYDSKNLISNEAFRKETEQSDKYFEATLLRQIADSDAAKAAEYGKESIKAGLDNNHVELLKKIYAKDVDKGIDFGAAILSRMKSDRSTLKNVYFYTSLLTFGSDNLEKSKKSGAKNPVYSLGDLRDIADQFAQVILDGTGDESDYMSESYAELIGKFAPSRSAQIKAKLKQTKTVISSANRYGANTMSVGTSTRMGSPSNSVSVPNPERADREARETIEREMMENVKGLGTKALPKDERDKIVAQARKIIAETKGRDKKIAALSLLAAQVARAGDKDLAAEIMVDADRLVNPQPKNYQDFLYSWMLASGYAESDPAKAFPILEDTILRANDTISAFIKVAEFIDVNEELIGDGEIQVGMFGGSMIREMTGSLGMASGTIGSLAKADFVRTKNLTNTFDRNEIRVLAKMMVVRAVLDKKERNKSIDEVLTEIDSDRVENNVPPPSVPARTGPR